MRYRSFRRQHLFVGSGVMEAGCRSIIASRRKRSGMLWTVGNAALSLRCNYLNGLFEDYWESRRAALAASLQLLCRAPAALFSRSFEILRFRVKDDFERIYGLL